MKITALLACLLFSSCVSITPESEAALVNAGIIIANSQLHAKASK